VRISMTKVARSALLAASLLGALAVSPALASGSGFATAASANGARRVAAAQTIHEIPTLAAWGLSGLTAAIAGAGLVLVRRRARDR